MIVSAHRVFQLADAHAHRCAGGDYVTGVERDAGRQAFKAMHSAVLSVTRKSRRNHIKPVSNCLFMFAVKIVVCPEILP